MRNTQSERSTHLQMLEAQPLIWLTLHPFQVYLNQQQLSWLAVAREANVPCLLVWNIAHGIQVQAASAMRVRVAVHRLSEVAYTGPIQTQAGQAQAVHTTRTLPLTKETLG